MMSKPVNFGPKEMVVHTDDSDIQVHHTVKFGPKEILISVHAQPSSFNNFSQVITKCHIYLAKHRRLIRKCSIFGQEIAYGKYLVHIIARAPPARNTTTTKTAGAGLLYIRPEPTGSDPDQPPQPPRRRRS
jgi:hypothetical protein